MKTKSLMVLALIALFIGMGTSAYAVTITPVVSSDAAGTMPITNIAPGSRFFVNVQVSDAAGIAGAALTITYNASLFEVIQHVSGQTTGTPITTGTEVNSATSTGTILDSDVLTAVSDKTGAAIGIFRVGKVNASTTPAKVMLSGAYINGTTGAGLATGQNKNIFRVLFRAKADATQGEIGQFALEQTVLDNATAGWGAGATPTNDGKVPVLVGAVPNTDTANFSADSSGKYTNAFPPIASTFGNAVMLTVQGTPGTVKDSSTNPPSLSSVLYLLYFTKYLENPSSPTYSKYNKIYGNGDFNHDGKFSLADVLYLLYYTKYLGEGTTHSGTYDKYSKIE